MTMEQKIIRATAEMDVELIDTAVKYEPWDKDMEFIDLSEKGNRKPDFWERKMIEAGIDIGLTDNQIM